MTPGEGFICRPVRGDELEAVAFLWREMNPRINELYRWRDQAREHSGGNGAWIVTHDGEIVAAMNSMPFSIAMNGRFMQAAWQLDSFVRPKMRRRGLATCMIAEVAPQATLLCASGTATSMYRARLKAGFRDLPGASYFVCALRPWHKGASSARVLRLSLGFGWSWAHRKATPSNIKVVEGEEFTEEFDELAGRVSRLNVLTPVKYAGYLQWRYGQRPGCSYSVLLAHERGGLRAALVLRNPSGGGIAWIVDYLGDPGDYAALDALLQAAREKLYRAGAACIWTFATSSRVCARLQRAGYLRSHLKPNFTYRLRHKGAFDPEVVEWNFYQGDGDLDLYE